MRIVDESKVKANWEHDSIFCINQFFDDGGHGLCCAAHLLEGRLFTCPYSGPQDEKAKNCQDFVLYD